jgi:chemotaxis signal transduction protein
MQPPLPPLPLSQAQPGNVSPSIPTGPQRNKTPGQVTHPPTPQLLFTIAGQLYACSTDPIIKFLARNQLEVSAVSDEQFPWWAGVFVEQGRVVPLLTLRGLWGYKPLGKGPETARQMVLLFQSRDQLWGLLLDSCQGVHPIPPPSRNDLPLTEALTGKMGSAFKAVLAWKGQFLVTTELEEVLTEDIRQPILDLVKTKYQPLVSQSHQLRLRDLELEVSQTPSVEGYIELADQYGAAGMPKEAARIIRVAEQLESSFLTGHTGETSTELFGRLKPGMLVEVVQALSRTSRTGQLTLETDSQTFHIHFKHGDVINATSLHRPPGMPSFIAAFQARQGTYRFAHRTGSTIERAFFSDTESLLLEAMQLLDEAAPNSMCI